MSAADASNKNSTTGAGAPRTPCTRPAGYLHTRSCLLTLGQQHRILDLFASEEHVTLEVTWSAYQNIIDAYRSSNARGGKTLRHEEITRLTSTSVPSSLTELITLGRTLKRRTTDIQAYFDHPHTTSDPTQAINAPLEHQRSRAPGLSKTSPTTSPEHSPKQENSNPNHTPNYEEPVNGLFAFKGVGGVGIRRSGGGSVGGSFGG